MFSGIVETTSRVLKAELQGDVLRIHIEKPINFSDLKSGDSISTDGVCLTLEAQEPQTLQFALGPETLRVTGWTADRVKDRVVNLERSLRLGDRIHGHLVTGHVDARSKVMRVENQGETTTMWIEIPESIKALVWPKGSVTLNGVSLTLNAVGESEFSVGLIPETLKRTNLGTLRVGDAVNVEADNMARGLVHIVKNMPEVSL